MNQIITNLNNYSDQQLINSVELNAEGKYDISNFVETITAYANHEFKQKIELSAGQTIIDAIAVGINFLGEELEHTSISRDHFSNIFNSISELLIVFNFNGIIIDTNKAAEFFLNRPKEKLIGKDLIKLLGLEEYFKDGNKDAPINSINNSKEFETKLYNSSGVDNHYLCSVSGFINNKNEDQLFLFIAKDISEKKNRDLIEKRNVVNAIEKDRKRLSEDIHDSLGQEINAIRLYLNSISLIDPSSNDFIPAIETCKSLLNSSVETVRNICFDLMPKSLANGGLIFACDELVYKLKQICEVDYNFPNFDLTISKENQTILYRIIQEFLNNSFKHSGCKKITLKIVSTKNKIKIILADNGKGFKIDDVIKGNGLQNIISRIDMLKVEYDFTSEIKVGTSLNLYIDK